MFISKNDLHLIHRRLGSLEAEVRDLKAATHVSADREGLLSSWHGAPATVVDALNALAKKTGFKWRQVFSRPASIEADG
jgi:hypothetical protein